MKKLALLMLLLPVAAFAQGVRYTAANELRGSGRIVQETTQMAPFAELHISQFPATVIVEAGAAESSVTVSIDDNLRSLLQLRHGPGKLYLSFRGEPDGQWVNNATIRVLVKTTHLTGLRHESNSDVLVRGVAGALFNLTNEANGNATLVGLVDTLNVVSRANGLIDASELPARVANIVTAANATLRINAQSVHELNSAHANITNQVKRPRPH
ncbi:MAG: DUF2807 domain-containing protein [Rudanella sp.]|nr:DUF2807 domain-containing protein [Rudanella sp.]